MTHALTILLLVAFAPLAIIWALWLLLAALAALPAHKVSTLKSQVSNPCSIDVLIPAHNEELLLPALLRSLQNQTPAGNARLGAILVVADHCNDNTAAIARQHGATVLERTSGPRGKPAALRDALAHLRRTSPGNALLLLDADCTASPNLVEASARALDRGCKVTQSAYILVDPENARTLSPSLLAFSLKNLIRPRGMARLGLPTQLFGTGMCFHPDLAASLTFHDHLIEDLALSHDLLLKNTPPVFLADALVSSPMPADKNAQTTQKLRWETGQLQTWKTLPPLAGRLLARGRLRSFIALLDWSAPPLALALIAWSLLGKATVILAAFGLISPFMLLVPALVFGILALYVLIGALQLAPPSAIFRLLVSIPRFVAWKLSLYAKLFLGHAPKSWQRTPRTATEVHP